MIYAHHLFLNDVEVKNLVIPDSITAINSYAFTGCWFTSVTIPNSITDLGSMIFKDCSKLTSVNWNIKSCKDFEYSGAPFAGLTNIKTFKFGDEVECIPAYLCCELTGLTSINIPNSVTTIGKAAFYGCSNIPSMTIPSSITAISSSAFGDCTSLREVHTPDLAVWGGIKFTNASANCVCPPAPARATSPRSNGRTSPISLK